MGLEINITMVYRIFYRMTESLTVWLTEEFAYTIINLSTQHIFLSFLLKLKDKVLVKSKNKHLFILINYYLYLKYIIFLQFSLQRIQYVFKYTVHYFPLLFECRKTWILDASTASSGVENRWPSILFFTAETKKKWERNQECIADDPLIRCFDRIFSCLANVCEMWGRTLDCFFLFFFQKPLVNKRFCAMEINILRFFNHMLIHFN